MRSSVAQESRSTAARSFNEAPDPTQTHYQQPNYILIRQLNNINASKIIAEAKTSFSEMPDAAPGTDRARRVVGYGGGSFFLRRAPPTLRSGAYAKQRSQRAPWSRGQSRRILAAPCGHQTFFGTINDSSANNLSLAHRTRARQESPAPTQCNNLVGGAPQAAADRYPVSSNSLAATPLIVEPPPDGIQRRR